MAKSLRSKWVRKCKREKRVRYGKKELASLVSMVEKASKNDVVVRDAAEGGWGWGVCVCLCLYVWGVVYVCVGGGKKTDLKFLSLPLTMGDA